MPRGEWRSSGPSSTWEPAAAAWTWARRRSATRGSGSGSRDLGLEVVDRGNVEAALPETVAAGDEHARFLPEIKATCERIAAQVAVADREGLVPIVLGGDHSIALGTVGGMAAGRGVGAALWFDAHGDLNTPETSPSGNVHGMPLAALARPRGRRVRERRSGRCRRSIRSGRR